MRSHPAGIGALMRPRATSSKTQTHRVIRDSNGSEAVNKVQKHPWPCRGSFWKCSSNAAWQPWAGSGVSGRVNKQGAKDSQVGGPPVLLGPFRPRQVSKFHPHGPHSADTAPPAILTVDIRNAPPSPDLARWTNETRFACVRAIVICRVTQFASYLIKPNCLSQTDRPQDKMDVSPGRDMAETTESGGKRAVRLPTPEPVPKRAPRPLPRYIHRLLTRARFSRAANSATSAGSARQVPTLTLPLPHGCCITVTPHSHAHARNRSDATKKSLAPTAGPQSEHAAAPALASGPRRPASAS